MRRILFSLLASGLLSIPVFATTDSGPTKTGIEMLIWEHQNWEANGGYRRLTLWRDGHSEVEVVPLMNSPYADGQLRPKEGWSMERKGRTLVFLRRNIYPSQIVRTKLRQALDAGILQLKTFRPNYLDGGGIRVVVQIDGNQQETIIPMFPAEEQLTDNHIRFRAVSEIIGNFDTDAIEWNNR